MSAAGCPPWLLARQVTYQQYPIPSWEKTGIPQAKAIYALRTIKRCPSKEFTVLMVHSAICHHLPLTCGRDLVLLAPNEANGSQIILPQGQPNTSAGTTLPTFFFFLPEVKNVIKWHIGILLGWLPMFRIGINCHFRSAAKAVYLNNK